MLWIPSHKQAEKNMVQLIVQAFERDQPPATRNIDFIIADRNQKPYFKESQTIYSISPNVKLEIDGSVIDPDNDKIIYTILPPSSKYTISKAGKIERITSRDVLIDEPDIVKLTITAKEDIVDGHEITYPIEIHKSIENKATIIVDPGKLEYFEGTKINAYLGIIDEDDEISSLIPSLYNIGEDRSLYKLLRVKQYATGFQIYSDKIIPHTQVTMDSTYRFKVSLTDRSGKIQEKNIDVLIKNKLDPNDLIGRLNKLEESAKNRLTIEQSHYNKWNTIFLKRSKRETLGKIFTISFAVVATGNSALLNAETRSSPTEIEKLNQITWIAGALSLGSLLATQLPTFNEVKKGLVKDILANARGRQKDLETTIYDINTTINLINKNEAYSAATFESKYSQFNKIIGRTELDYKNELNTIGKYRVFSRLSKRYDKQKVGIAQKTTRKADKRAIGFPSS